MESRLGLLRKSGMLPVVAPATHFFAVSTWTSYVKLLFIMTCITNEVGNNQLKTNSIWKINWILFFVEYNLGLAFLMDVTQQVSLVQKSGY